MNKKITARPEFTISMLTVAAFIIFSIITPQFLTGYNVKLFLSQSTIVGLIGIGMTMVVLLGGIDLSAGSILAVTGSIIGRMLMAGQPISFSILCALGAGLGLGFLNGKIITKLNIPDIIATMGTMFAFRGLAILLSGGEWLTNFPKEFNFLGKEEVLGIPFSFLLMLIILVIFAFILSQTTFGRSLYATGGNSEAAKLSGINTDGIKVAVYTMSGVLSALAAAIYASKVGSVQASTAGTTLSNEVLAAVLIGGTSIYGGSGTVIGTMIGAIFLSMIKNALVLTQGISEYWIDALTGIMIIAAVLFNTYRSYRKLRLQERSMI